VPNADSCRPCPAGASCPYGSTVLPYLFLEPGTWRISEAARTFEKCQEGPHGATPCRGGTIVGDDGDGYCHPGNSGPLCQLCLEESHYFDWRSASCVKCPLASRYSLVYGLLIGVPVSLGAIAMLASRSSPRARRVLQYSRSLWEDFNFEAKLKIVIGFVQVISVIGPVYSLTMPSLYRFVLQALEVVYMDIFGDVFVPMSCIGGLFNFLVFKACFPISLLLAAGTWRTFRWFCRTRRSTDGGQAFSARSVRLCVETTVAEVMPLALWVGIFFCVSVSSSILSALHCRRFVDDLDRQLYREFAIESLDIECPTEGHPASPAFYQLRALVIVLILMWPGACLVGLAVLLWKIRRQVIARRPNKLSHAARLLTRDYRPAFFWWDWLELLRRLILTGFVLVVPERLAFLRLIVALLLSVLFLVAQTILRPFKDTSLQAFSSGLQVVTIVLFMGATYMYAYQQFGIAIANGGTIVRWQEGRLSPLVNVFVFETLDDLALLCLVVMCVLALALILQMVRAAFNVSNAEVIKLKKTRAAPMLSIRKEHRYHIFLSHVWATGQDQVAVIKRQLLRMVRGMSIFLDVDDLQDIGLLETYVEQSMVILVFISRGYFASRNCLREIKAAMALGKEIILVLELNDNKGGLSLDEAKKECPDELREYVFGPQGKERGVMVWHRITIFQLCTLKEIVCTTLRFTPLYAEEPNLTVYLDSDVDLSKLKFSRPVALYTSPNNPGGRAVANELAVHFNESELMIIEEPLPDMLPPKYIDSQQTACVELPDDHAVQPVDAESISLALDGGGAPVGSGPSTSSQDAARSLPSSESRSAHSLDPFSMRRTSDKAPGRVRKALSEHVNLGGRRQVFLLYLNSNTFVERPGALLALEVAQAMERRLHIVMLHEHDPQRSGCEFSYFFRTTPRELVNRGLYEPLALGMYPMPHREVSLALVAQALGATKKMRFGRIAKSCSAIGEQSRSHEPSALEQGLSFRANKLVRRGVSPLKRRMSSSSSSCCTPGRSLCQERQSEGEADRELHLWEEHGAKLSQTSPGVERRRDGSRRPSSAEHAVFQLSERKRSKQPIASSRLEDVEPVDLASRESESSISGRACVICWENPRTFAANPCGHHCLCTECATSRVGAPCPICRVEVVGVMRIFDV